MNLIWPSKKPWSWDFISENLDPRFARF